MLGRWVSDLVVGDVLPAVEYELSPFLVREYCHGVEEDAERFVGVAGGAVGPPTMVHVDKLRVLDRGCPEGAGPVPRLQYEFDAQWFRPVAVGTRLRVEGEVVERSERNGRERLIVVFEARDAATGALCTRYRDISLLNFRPREAS